MVSILVVKALCDSVAPGKAPHSRDFFFPGVEGIAESDELCEAALTEIGDGTQEARDELLTGFAGFVFLQQQVAEALFETIDLVQRRVLGQICQQARLLLGFEVMAVAAHQGHPAAVLGAYGIDLAPARQEVMVDEADDMEAVGDDESIGEVDLNHGAIDRRQVHADDADLPLAFQGNEIGL